MSDLERLIADLSADDRAELAAWFAVVEEFLQVAEADPDPAARRVMEWLRAGAPAREEPLELLADDGVAALRAFAIDNAGRVEHADLGEVVSLAHESPWSEPIREVWHELAIACSEELDRRRRVRTDGEGVIVGPLELGPGDDDAEEV